MPVENGIKLYADDLHTVFVRRRAYTRFMRLCKKKKVHPSVLLEDMIDTAYTNEFVIRPTIQSRIKKLSTGIR